MLALIMKTIINFLWCFCSGEFFFYLFGRTPNGGALIALRTVFVSLLIFLTYLGLKSTLEVGASWTIDFTELRIIISKSLAVLGVIMAGVYTALYARFSDQWNYIAGLYNEIITSQLEHDKLIDELRIKDFTVGNILNTDYKSLSESFNSYKTLCAWKAGFIEDAEDLHLVTKRMFKPAIKKFLSDKNIRDHFINHTINGSKRLKWLERMIN